MLKFKECLICSLDAAPIVAYVVNAYLNEGLLF